MVTHKNPSFYHHCSFGWTICNYGSKPRHLKHFVFEILVGDLGVEVEGLETLWLEMVSFEKLEGKVFVEILFLSFHEDL